MLQMGEYGIDKLIRGKGDVTRSFNSHQVPVLGCDSVISR